MSKNNKGRVPVQNPTPKTTDTRNRTPTASRAKALIVRLAVWGLIPAGFATWLLQRGGLNDA